MANLVKVDHQSTGVPLPYGLDITPDGRVWFARLYTNEIGSIDPDTGKLTMIPTPFKAPRRLRADAQGNLWIAAFNESPDRALQPPPRASSRSLTCRWYPRAATRPTR